MIGSYNCQWQQNIIRMPIVNTIQSYQPYHYQSSCGQVNCYNGGMCQVNPYTQVPTCMCRAPFTGNNCENSRPQQNQNQHLQQSNNLCRVFNERNMNICQNGGQCVFVSDGKVACLCPTTFKGLFCELPVYLPCNGDPSKTCHRDHSVCAVNGSCICDEGYTGPRCDKVEACKTDYCLNGATCEESAEDPYRKCKCPQNYQGRRCENFGIQLNNGTFVKFNRPCNLTLSVFNQGGYVLEFSVTYNTVFGDTESVSRSGVLLGQTKRVTIPFYASNLVVTIKTNLNKVIHVDRSLIGDLPCQKCYKTWGIVGFESWDYIRC